MSDAGARLGRYRLIERVAVGGMGEIFRAIDSPNGTPAGEIERIVALKRIAPMYAREPEFVRTFMREASLSFLLGHANVVRVLDVGQANSDGDDGSLFLVLEWIDGADLGTLIDTLKRDAKQAVPTRLALTIAAEIARGLDYAHRVTDASGRPLGIVHRDVSPSNVLISVEGEVKVTDFGIARSRLRPSASLPGQLKGKLFYMSPEQAIAGDIDARADVFALGAVLYEMLCGENPFCIEDGGTGGNDRDLIERVRRGQYPPPSRFAPGLPSALESIVLRAMAPRREDRFPTAAAMREALEQYAVSEGYALSLDELGRFVRVVRQGEVAPPLATLGTEESRRATTKPNAAPATTTTRPTTPERPRVAFNFGELGGASATAEVRQVEPAPPEPVDDVVQTARQLRPKPVAAPPSSSPSLADASLDAVPRTRSAAWLAAGLAVGVLVALGGTAVYRELAPTAVFVTGTLPATAKTSPPPPPPTTTMTPASTPHALTPMLIAPSHPHIPHPHVPTPAPDRPALLTIETDVSSDIFVDNELAGRSPLRDFPVDAGTHHVRAQSSVGGLLLIPVERDIKVTAGETTRVSLRLHGSAADDKSNQGSTP